MTVLAVHVVLGMYGFWPPNDPRGSWSKFVGDDDLYDVGGRTTKTGTRNSVAAKPHDKELRNQIIETLKYPPVVLNGIQARAVARGFAKVEHPIFACSIMPEHVHLVLGRSTLPAKKIAGLLKRLAEEQLRVENIFPDVETIWADGCWQTFLNTPTAVSNAMRYVEQNPIKSGLKPQRWSFVVPPPFHVN